MMNPFFLFLLNNKPVLPVQMLLCETYTRIKRFYNAQSTECSESYWVYDVRVRHWELFQSQIEKKLKIYLPMFND